MTNQTIKSTGCCEPFDPTPWRDTSTDLAQAKKIVWQNKLFVKDHVTSFFHIPLNMGKKIIKNIKLIEQAGAKSPYQLMLTDEKSLWGADIYIDVAKEVPGAQMASLSGTFLTKVFEGPYQNVGKWAREIKEYVKNQGKELKKLYFSYTTCPRCAKVYGKNYVVLFAQIN
jgi:effector-binding domain-containing protein